MRSICGYFDQHWSRIVFDFGDNIVSTSFTNINNSYQARVNSIRLAPSQWETALLRNDVAHWLGASLESALASPNWAITGPTNINKCCEILLKNVIYKIYFHACKTMNLKISSAKWRQFCRPRCVDTFSPFITCWYILSDLSICWYIHLMRSLPWTSFH